MPGGPCLRGDFDWNNPQRVFREQKRKRGGKDISVHAAKNKREEKKR